MLFNRIAKQLQCKVGVHCIWLRKQRRIRCLRKSKVEMELSSSFKTKQHIPAYLIGVLNALIVIIYLRKGIE